MCAYRPKRLNNSNGLDDIMSRSKRFAILDLAALWPVAALLAALTPVVWAVACVALMVVVLVPGTFVLLLLPGIVVVARICPAKKAPAKKGTRVLWWPLPPFGWLCHSWLRWPWLYWTWLCPSRSKDWRGKGGTYADGAPC